MSSNLSLLSQIFAAGSNVEDNIFSAVSGEVLIYLTDLLKDPLTHSACTYPLPWGYLKEGKHSLEFEKAKGEDFFGKTCSCTVFPKPFCLREGGEDISLSFQFKRRGLKKNHFESFISSPWRKRSTRLGFWFSPT